MKLPMISQLLRYAPLVVGVAILGVAAFLVPWKEVGPYLARLTPLTVIILIGLSILYYFGRSLRYYAALRMLGDRPSLYRVFMAVMIAQPVAVLPGGELYRASMLERYAGAPTKRGLPSVFAQSVTEAIGLLALAIIGSLTLHRYLFILLGLATVFGALLALVRYRTHTTHRIVNRIPFVNVSPNRLRAFMRKNRALLSGRNFISLIAISLVTTLTGVAIVYVAATTLGAGLNPFQAMIAYTLPTVLEAVSFLPGGLGVSEGGAVSIYSLFGTGLPLAVAITIITRLTTLGLGFPLGFIALGLARLTNLDGSHRG